jgi:3-oxoacyl-[acyl-carrier protein] reductase
MKLEGRVALVTGASRGIGSAIAQRLAAEGARVAVNWSRSSEAAEETAERIRASGGAALTVRADVSSAGQVDAMVKSVVEGLGPIEILVNNAGCTRDRLLIRMTEEDWDAVVDTNLKGAFLCARAVAGGMLRRRSGVIVNVGSVVGRVGGAGQANYSASKAGLVGLTKSLAKELGSRNIRVNGIAPGFVDTDMTAELKPEYREEILQRIPLRRFGSVEDIARATAFLCSDDSAYISGEVITVDGGLFA